MPLVVSSSIEVSSPAKLNLSLRLLAPRPQDGFTELHSIVALVDWQDKLIFQPSETVLLLEDLTVCPKIDFTCSIPTLTTRPDDNLVVKAVGLFYERLPLSVLPLSHRPTQWFVQLQKNIPSQAGLGGGSSNAASTLRFLNQWHQATQSVTCYSLLALQGLGAELGSDVSLFLASETPALVCMAGRGERVTALPPQALNSLVGVTCVVVKPKAISVSTPLAFQALHRQQAYSQVSEMAQLAWLEGLMAGERLGQLNQYMVNEFEPLVWQLAPALQPLTEKLKRLGAFHTLLCGSGSAIVGLFETAMQPAHTLLHSLFPRVDFEWVCVPFLGQTEE
jgi:4-diphosphocytidyl-2-C-methyl-D-erythritol kinase